MGSLEGIFVADPQEVKQLIDSEKDVYFGEVLGKHSEIFGPISENEITMVSDDPAFVKLFEAHNLSSGFVPLTTSNTSMATAAKMAKMATTTLATRTYRLKVNFIA